MSDKNLPPDFIEEKETTYDGRWCTSGCNKDFDCPHEEEWDEKTEEDLEDFSGSDDSYF